MTELAKHRYTQNRELSWLKFNERVLEEAQDEDVPVLERLKFLSIFTSNLDEFFMVRVGSLLDLFLEDNTIIDKKSGMTPDRQLDEVYGAVWPLYAKRDLVYADIESELRECGIYALRVRELEPDEKKFVKTYFKDQVLPVLSPQIVDVHHPFPHLASKAIHVAALLKRKNSSVLGLAALPGTLPRALFLPGRDIRYVLLEDILWEYIGLVFDRYEVTEKNILCVTRNADIHYDDETLDVEEGDVRFLMKKLLHKRRRLAVVRLELAGWPSEAFAEYFCKKLHIQTHMIFVTRTPMNMDHTAGFGLKLPPALERALTYPEFTPKPSAQVTDTDSIARQVRKRDILLSYPFESMEPFLRMIREAARDPSVVAIKLSIYRVAQKARLIESLCAAAENGKDVTVLIELRARFDEQNNINWSERLEEAGCRLIFGFEDFKVHAKVCLIVRKEKGGIHYTTQVGTGNYNEVTAAQYTDLSLITADQGIGEDAAHFFNNMAMNHLDGVYRHFLVAPGGLKLKILALIEEQTRQGEQGRIILKLNALTDIDIIEKLSEASRAGVRVDLIIRGICCLLPGLPGQTDNITVTSVVGRFLEHSRIYAFGEGDRQTMYISSADMMTRSTHRRVEVACPVYDPRSRERVGSILDLLLRDNVKARQLRSDGFYEKKRTGQSPVSSQDALIQDAAAQTAAKGRPGKRKKKSHPRLKRWLEKWAARL